MMTDPERTTSARSDSASDSSVPPAGSPKTELAAGADFARSLLGSVERGDHPTGLLTFIRLAAALDVPLRDLIDPHTADREVARVFGNSSD